MYVDNKLTKEEPPKENIEFIIELFNFRKLIDAKKKIEKLLIDYPKSSILFNILGAVFAEQNMLEEALQNYSKAIKINPNYVQAYNNLGVCKYKLGKKDEAIKVYEKAIKINPLHADTYNNLGVAFKLTEINANEKSIKFYKKAIEIEPNHADAHNNLGSEFRKLKDYEKSIYHYEKAIAANPKLFIAYSNLGNVYKRLGNYKAAIKSQEKAIKINPKSSDAYYNLGTIFEKLNEFEKAIKCYEKTLDIQPNHIEANSNLLFNVCWSNNNNSYLNDAKKYYKSIKKIDKRELTNLKTSNEKILKIGFISGDFRYHPVTFFLLDTLKNLKKKNIKIFAYSNNVFEDSTTKLIKKYFDNWISVINKSDKDLINLIRKDNIDILFDLAGFTAQSRLAIFKNRCAPTQISWCGWLASSGVEEMDYIIGDKYATPLSEQENFTEKIYQLKKIWQCLSISGFDSNISYEKKNIEKNIVYGSFVNNIKINQSVINIWSKILNQNPDSKLYLKCSSFDIPEAKNNFLKRIENAKINKNQLIIEGRTAKTNYLECYNEIDILLDTFPISGVTTNFEASYMGVPILTKINENNFWFRGGESINNNLNMKDWIAKNENEYVQKAIEYSQNKTYLTKLRTELRNTVAKSPLFDSEDYANEFYEMLIKVKK
tara:strand:- start:2085 stop:4058 length:1974 start_codon:yes stop_codon:yes gene_type:complete